MQTLILGLIVLAVHLILFAFAVAAVVFIIITIPVWVPLLLIACFVFDWSRRG